MNTFSLQSYNLAYDIGDCIEFKRFSPSVTTDTFEYILCNGQVIDNSNPDLLEVSVYNNTTKEFDDGVCWVNPSSIIRYYPKIKIPRLSPRLILKDIWKDLIFREVKTVKTKEQLTVTYEYINDSGFVRTECYDSIEDAFDDVPRDKHCNIHVHYRDYFGFTTHRAIRNNDIHCNQEIFFSRKCYGELNLNGNTITGNFSMRRGFKTIPPRKKQYVCGLVETGEKGLFYRKWFVCSKEFLTLWTMICEPDHYSLKNKKEDGSYVTKDFEEIMKELDTSVYDVSILDRDIETKKELYRSYNVENQALYIPNVYQRIAQSLFKLSKRDTDFLYPMYEDRFRSDLIWMKNSIDDDIMI